MQHVLLHAGHQERLDCRNMECDIVNPLPVICAACGHCDLDHVPQPYALVKSKTLAPNEVELAHAGNLLVRDRIKQVLELVAPGQCKFYPTVYQKTSDITPWHLAVPQHQVEAATLGGPLRFCNHCGQPADVHPGTHYRDIHFGYVYPNRKKSDRYTNESKYDILKTSTWYSSGPRAYPESSRNLYLSVRLLNLLKSIQVAMIEQTLMMQPNPHAGQLPMYIAVPPLLPTAEDLAWIAKMQERISAAGIPMKPAGVISTGDTRWFNNYLKEHQRSKPKPVDLKGIEKKLGLKLPPSYIKFIQSIGPQSFDITEEGFVVKLLSPNKLHELEPDELDEGSRSIRALVFAETDYGDVLCFDVKPGQREYAVYQLNHEVFVLEPHTENFAECIKRLAGA